MATRKKCKKCRIMKCFRVGMRRDWIMTEVEREEKRRKIEENRRRKAINGTLIISDNNMDSPLDTSRMSDYSCLGDMQGSISGTMTSLPKVVDLPIDPASAQFPVRRRRRRRRNSSIDNDKKQTKSTSNDRSTDSLSSVKTPTSTPTQLPASNNIQFPLTPTKLAPISKPNESNNNTETTSVKYMNENTHKILLNNSKLTDTNSTTNQVFDFYNNMKNTEKDNRFKLNKNIEFSGVNYDADVLSDSNNNNNEDSKRRKRRKNKNDTMYKPGSKTMESNSMTGVSGCGGASSNVSGLTNGYPQCSSPSICSTSSDSHDSNSYSPTPSLAAIPNNDHLLSTSLTDLQIQQIDAIKLAYTQAINLVKSQGLPKNVEDINTTINVTELAVRRIIFYFKLISDFRNLEHDLMVTLLKNSMMSLLQIHGINSYNKIDHSFKEPDTDDVPFSASSLETVYGPEVYKIAISVTRNLYDLCDGDLTHIKLLMLIVLFEPANEFLSEREKHFVTNLQTKYITLLYAYLRFKFGSPKAELIYKTITFELGKIIELSKWFEKTVAEKSDHEFVRPLMKEVFSIPIEKTDSSIKSVSSNQTPVNSYSSCLSNNPMSSASTSVNSIDSNYETPATTSTSVSDSSLVLNNNCEFS